MMDSIFIIGGILVFLIFLLSLAIIHLGSVRDEINNRWYNLAEKLQYRQDMMPNLIETIRQFIPSDKLNLHNGLIQTGIEARNAAAKNIKPGADKIILEHELSRIIAEMLKLGEKYESLGKSTNYLELKKEFKDLYAGIEELTKDYNNRVRGFNSILARPYNIPAALITKNKKKLIFEFE